MAKFVDPASTDAAIAQLRVLCGREDCARTRMSLAILESFYPAMIAEFNRDTPNKELLDSILPALACIMTSIISSVAKPTAQDQFDVLNYLLRKLHSETQQRIIAALDPSKHPEPQEGFVYIPVHKGTSDETQ